jgi:uncharacterized protein involved in exopolysaccharide biosynthesis
LGEESKWVLILLAIAIAVGLIILLSTKPKYRIRRIIEVG